MFIYPYALCWMESRASKGASCEAGTHLVQGTKHTLIHTLIQDIDV